MDGKTRVADLPNVGSLSRMQGMAFEHDSSGWFSGARRCPSSNFNARPVGVEPELVVVHSISLPPGCYGGGEVEALFCNRLDCSRHPFYSQLVGLRVSAHFLIERSGELIQFVSCQDRAWHAGESHWRMRSNCNDFSIGIELEGMDVYAYETAQYKTLSGLLAALFLEYSRLSMETLVGHSDIAPGRKTDPGPAFNWAFLHRLLRNRLRPGVPEPPLISSSGTN
ncbi:MAG: 1,6-anhydro-N-acetylmuramyl-L-alanine amidase AmpD [Pseudomonadota bacterium]